MLGLDAAELVALGSLITVLGGLITTAIKQRIKLRELQTGTEKHLQEMARATIRTILRERERDIERLRKKLDYQQDQINRLRTRHDAELNELRRRHDVELGQLQERVVHLERKLEAKKLENEALRLRIDELERKD